MSGRTRLLVGLARNVKYCIVKNLEENRLQIIPKDEVESSENQDLHIVKTANGKRCHAIVILTGEKEDMARSMQELINYERIQQKYHSLANVTVETQTEGLAESRTNVEATDKENNDNLENILTGRHLVDTYSDAGRCTTLSKAQQQQHWDPMTSNYTATGKGMFLKTSSNEVATETKGIERLTYKRHTLGDSSIRESQGTEVIEAIKQNETITDLDNIQDDQQPSGFSVLPHSSTAEAPPLVEELPSEAEAEVQPQGFSVLPHSSTAEAPPLVEELPSEAEAEVQPQGSPTTETYKRKPFCTYCKTTQTNLNRHLVSKHKDEAEVSEALNKCSKTKHIAFMKIKRWGEIEKYGDCKVRKGAKSTYVDCPNCGASFSKNNLYRHYKICTGQRNPKNLKTIAGHITQIKCKKTPDMSKELKEIVIPGMSCSQDLFEAITTDEHIIGFGNDQCVRFGPEISKQKNLVRLKLRNLAKVRLGVSKLDPTVTGLLQVYSIDQWNNLMNVIASLSNLSSDKSKQAPTTVRHLGLLLSNAAKDIKAGLSIQTEERRQVKAWIEMFERKYQNTIGWQANKAAVKKKWENRKLEPLANDIFKLNHYTKQNMVKSVQALKRNYDGAAFETLSKSCMTHAVTFNRKRIGEITDITVEDYKRKDQIQEDSDIYLGLSDSERVYAKRYFHLTIRGKLGRPVPLLISKELAEAIDLLLKYRKEAGVDDENQFLFAKKGMSHYNGNLVLREAAYECGAENPADLTGTRLRKHVATVAQTLDLTEGDLRVLCGYLGHTTKTHMENYRLPSDAVHAAKLSRLLIALDEGKIHQYRGKRIEDIDTNFEISQDDEIEKKFKETVRKRVKEETLTTETLKAKKNPTKTELPTHKGISWTGVNKEQTTPEKLKKNTASSSSEDCDIVLTPSPKKKKRNKWLTPERRAMKKHFSVHIASKTLPTPRECTIARAKESALRSRKIHIMKAWVSNQIKKRKMLKDDDEEEED